MNDQQPGIFDPSQHTPSTGMSPGLPLSDANGHVVNLIAAEMKPTQKGDGGYLELKMRILEGPHKGMEGVDRLNLANANPQTCDIAARQLSAYCAVTGVTQQFNYLQNCSVLHGKPFRAIVVQQTNNSGYTEVREVRFLDGRKANQGSPAQAGGFPSQVPSVNTQQPPAQFSQPQQQFQQPQQQQWQQPQQQQQWQQPQIPQQPPQQQWQQPQPQQQMQPPQQPPQDAMPWNQQPPQGT